MVNKEAEEAKHYSSPYFQGQILKLAVTTSSLELCDILISKPEAFTGEKRVKINYQVHNEEYIALLHVSLLF